MHTDMDTHTLTYVYTRTHVALCAHTGTHTHRGAGTITVQETQTCVGGVYVCITLATRRSRNARNGEGLR